MTFVVILAYVKVKVCLSPLRLSGHPLLLSLHPPLKGKDNLAMVSDIHQLLVLKIR